MIKFPEGITEAHLTYLDSLRESEATNMFGAGEYIVDEFGVDKYMAREIVSFWMETFEERMKGVEN